MTNLTIGCVCNNCGDLCEELDRDGHCKLCVEELEGCNTGAVCPRCREVAELEECGLCYPCLAETTERF